MNDLHELRLQSPDRPLIFIAHSLGGLVLKEGLRRSFDASGNFRMIALSTIGTIFMGTPHRGSAMAHPASTLARISKLAGIDTTTSLIRDLTPNSAFLDLLTVGFRRVHDAVRFDVYSFTESKGVRLLLSRRMVVDDYSARLDWSDERTDVINADHQQMCRFSGPGDQGYQKLKASLSRTLQAHVSSYHSGSSGFSSIVLGQQSFTNRGL
jgi:hypothetical protein